MIEQARRIQSGEFYFDVCAYVNTCIFAEHGKVASTMCVPVSGRAGPGTAEALLCIQGQNSHMLTGRYKEYSTLRTL